MLIITFSCQIQSSIEREKGTQFRSHIMVLHGALQSAAQNYETDLPLILITF
jgi:hypothetical protein